MHQEKNFFDQQFEQLGNDEDSGIEHAFYKPLVRYAKSRNQVALEMLAGERFRRAVELGCGEGAFVACKADDLDQYVGLDVSEYRLNRLADDLKQNTRLEFKPHDMNQGLPFEDASFSFAISLSVIEYLFDPQAFVAEAHRILEKGGTFLLHTMNVAFLPRRLQSLFGKLPTFNNALGWEGGVAHRFTYPAMRKLLSEAGFLIKEERCSGLYPRARMWWPNLLAGDMLFRCVKST